MNKKDIANELVTLTSQKKILEERIDELKAYLDKHMAAGERIGNVLKVGESSVLNIEPLDARNLFDRWEDMAPFMKISVSDLKRKVGEDALVNVGAFYTPRASYIKVNVK